MAGEVSLPILYHEGYLEGTSTQDQQGAWEPVYNLKLWLLIRNTGLNDGPSERVFRLEDLEPMMYQALNIIKESYDIIGNVPFSGVLNVTDTNLDGIRFVINAKSKYPVLPDC